MARVVFFAFDIAEAAQLRRIGSIRALGHRVASVSFRRDNMRAGVGPDWPNLDLGPSSNNRYLLRLLRLGRAALRLWRGRDILGMSDVWIARNLDMVLLAVLMRRVSGQRQVGWSMNAWISTACSRARTRWAPPCAGSSGGCWRAAIC
jgi:succinoglycan biosynthesis protein ExoL